MLDPTLINWFDFVYRHPEYCKYFKAALVFDENPSLGRTLQLVPPQSSHAQTRDYYLLSLPPILVQAAMAKFHIWSGTCHGSITINSERPNKAKHIRACVLAGSSYQHYISESDVELQEYQILCNTLFKKIWMT